MELLNNPLSRQQWQEEDEEDPAFYTVNLNSIPGITEWKAFNWYRLPDNLIVGAWKGESGSKKIYLAVSTGTNWIPGSVATPVNDATFRFKDNAKTWGARTEDGRYAMAGCLDLTRRWPLAATTSADGWTFDTPYLIISGDVPMQRYEESRTVYGDAKNTGPQYVRGFTTGNGDPPGTALWGATPTCCSIRPRWRAARSPCCTARRRRHPASTPRTTRPPSEEPSQEVP